MRDISEIKDIYPFEPHFLKLYNYKYHYVDEGEGEPILMVHGNPTWSFFFRNLIYEFRTTNRVIAPDHLGCGLSDKPQKFMYRLEMHVNNLEQLVLSLDLHNITLVMHDWGGAIGMGFALRHPERIKRLVILNTAAFSMNWIPLRINLCRLPWLGDKLVRRFNLFVRAALHMTTVKHLSHKAKCGYLLPYNSYANRIAVLKFIQDIPLDPEDASFEALVGIEHGLWLFKELPICIIWGMKDWCFTPRFLSRWKIYYPDAEVHELKNAGHYVLEDSPVEAARIMREFINKNPIAH